MVDKPDKSHKYNATSNPFIGWLQALILLGICIFAVYGLYSFMSIKNENEQKYLLCFTDLNDTDNSLSLLYEWQQAYLLATDARQRALAVRQIEGAIDILNGSVRKLEELFVQFEDDLGLTYLKLDIQMLLEHHRTVMELSKTKPKRAAAFSRLQYRSLNDMIKSRIMKIQERNLLQASLSNERQYTQLVVNLVIMVVLLILLLFVLLVNADVRRRAQLELKESEARFQQSQKMESIGRLAGGVAHDFNNMLTGIIGTAELGKIQVPDNNYTLKQFDQIIAISDQAARLTSKLLAFARKGKMFSVPYDIHKCIRDIICILERSIDRRITIKTSLQAECSSILADPSQIQNAFLNLGINARDAMPNGGELLISTEQIDLDEAFCNSSQFDLTPGPFVIVSVCDTGVGMDSETLEKIFEPFFTTKELGQGTGLGLSAVYGAIKEHHGAIEVFSEINKGSVFKVYLPLKSMEVEALPIQRDELQFGSGRILVVDDEEIVRLNAACILKSLGYKVLIAADGVEAIEMYKKHQHKIDLVLLDMIMPKVNGKQVFREIRKLNKKARILLTSGYTREKIAPELQEAEMVGFLKKPYQKTELSRAVKKALA